MSYILHSVVAFALYKTKELCTFIKNMEIRKFCVKYLQHIWLFIQIFGSVESPLQLLFQLSHNTYTKKNCVTIQITRDSPFQTVSDCAKSHAIGSC